METEQSKHTVQQPYKYPPIDIHVRSLKTVEQTNGNLHSKISEQEISSAKPTCHCNIMYVRVMHLRNTGWQTRYRYF
ncbi:hypothetical protein Bhyg_14128 [Pseudolycoriella hygida]|uniref:Uncharacterized protein n=1 Tax=Pseudolycoriella hygida TaxID=35572 RepID=A0A9Q0MSL0_9DIPT|nr:hypothetical protein Bhyg_14128 [Pseudolycoriella hygida]